MIKFINLSWYEDLRLSQVIRDLVSMTKGEQAWLIA
jgi:hypothetical protein